MARLNEPLAPAESLESLKRRFIRQNRELARVNSAQSIRIRSLEGDLARLLGENAELQNRIITLEKDMTEGLSRQTAKSIESVQSKLDAKIQDLVELTRELSQFSRQHRRRSSDAPRDLLCLSRRSPSQRQWRNTSSLHDILAAQDGLLPTIVEDKHFPRKTLGTNELSTLLHDDCEGSPDIGPPPKASFENEDDGPFREVFGIGDEERTAAGPLANLETRRRRRDRRSIEDAVAVGERFESLANADSKDGVSDVDPVKQAPRTGVKRKFDINHSTFLEHTSTASNRNPSPVNRLQGKVSTPRIIMNVTGENATAEAVPSSPVRKALLPKNGNLGIGSPQKPLKMSDKPMNDSDSIHPPRKSTNASAKRDRKSKPKIIRLPQSVEVLAPEAESIKIEPKTPAPLQLFSPQSSQPSETRQELRDTPPPTDLKTNERGEGNEGIGRHSRRARAIVSYAEPSLVSKMRRPTKELADAVSREDRRSSVTPSLPQVNAITSAGGTPALFTSRTPAGLTKPQAHDVEPNLTDPQSPLGDKAEKRLDPKPEQGGKANGRVSDVQRRPMPQVLSMSNVADFESQEHIPSETVVAHEATFKLAATDPTPVHPAHSTFATETNDTTSNPYGQDGTSAPKAGVLPLTRPASSRRQSMGPRTTAADVSSNNAQSRAGLSLNAEPSSSSRFTSARNSSVIGRVTAKSDPSIEDHVNSEHVERSKRAEEARARGERIAARRRSMAL